MILPVFAAVVAAWIVVRFPRLRPQSFAVSCLHTVIAYFGGLSVGGYLIGFIYALSFRGGFELAVVVGGFLPLVYFFVSLVWLIRALRSHPKPPRGHLVQAPIGSVEG
jgi:hypothetical protein